MLDGSAENITHFGWKDVTKFAFLKALGFVRNPKVVNRPTSQSGDFRHIPKTLHPPLNFPRADGPLSGLRWPNPLVRRGDVADINFPAF